VAEVKNFAIHELGLKSSNNYLEYKESNPRTIYRLYAVPKTELPDEIDDWIHIKKDGEYRELQEDPFALRSSVDKFLDEETFYKDKKYDVIYMIPEQIEEQIIGEGCNLTPEFLRRARHDQAETIIHEDWHYSFDAWSPFSNPEREIDEAAASVLGYVGAIEFMEHKYGKDSDEHKSAIAYFESWKKYTKVRNDTFEELQGLYNTCMEEEDKLALRDDIFQKRRDEGYILNNATLWEDRAYIKNSPLILNVYEKAGSARQLVKVMKDCPTDEEGALEYIRGYLGQG
ncbi:hypothetical protein ACFL96_16810, partial [Thermoproteota archaeon]